MTMWILRRSLIQPQIIGKVNCQLNKDTITCWKQFIYSLVFHKNIQFVKRWPSYMHSYNKYGKTQQDTRLECLWSAKTNNNHNPIPSNHRNICECPAFPHNFCNFIQCTFSWIIDIKKWKDVLALKCIGTWSRASLRIGGKSDSSDSTEVLDFTGNSRQ